MVAISVPHPHAGHGPSVGPRRRTARPSPQVYRRRRLVAAALVAGALLAGLWSMGLLDRAPLSAIGQVRSHGGAPTLELVDHRTYVVQPGDTLWSIARRAHPGGDVRPLVDQLAAQTAGRPLQVGDRITIP